MKTYIFEFYYDYKPKTFWAFDAMHAWAFDDDKKQDRTKTHVPLRTHALRETEAWFVERFGVTGIKVTPAATGTRLYGDDGMAERYPMTRKLAASPVLTWAGVKNQILTLEQRGPKNA